MILSLDPSQLMMRDFLTRTPRALTRSRVRRWSDADRFAGRG